MPITAFSNFTDGLDPNRRSREHFITKINLEDDRLWVPYANGVWFQPCCFNVTSGGFSVVLKGLPGSMVGTHYHVGTVHGYTMRGHWRYLEHDWIAKPGTYIYEPAGEAHTLVITEDSPEPMITLFVVGGGLVYLDKAENGGVAEMRAVRLVQVGKPLEQADIRIPEIGSSDVLIRVAAAGICHSDAHYRAGSSKIDSLPVTLGHEVAGRVEKVGAQVANLAAGDRVCVHYLVTCGRCDFCKRGKEQFCRSGQMIGKHRDGGYAEFIKVPVANALPLPDEIPFEVGAIMMCSSATALHALNKARFKAGESIAIFGFGGLGFSALQLARALDCGDVYVVEINPAKLASAVRMGAIALDARAADPVEQIKEATVGRGVDVALELIGSAKTMRQAVLCLGPLGRAAVVGLTAESMSIFPYTELINKEVEIIGVSDHLATELPALIEFARSGKLGFPPETLRVVDLDAAQINAALESLEDSIDHVRTVIVRSSDK